MRHITADAAETERIGEIAAQALSDIHTAIYGQPPAAARAWVDGDAILLVMRLAPEVTTLGGEPPLASMQRMVAAAVERRTGESLRAASTSVDPERGLVVLAFERVRAAVPEPQTDRAPAAGPVRGAG
ncbi:MAG: hypothetical protein ABR947_02825 [Solirubrobacteraceae bacterium]